MEWVEWTVISRKIEGKTLEWETILEVGGEQFLLSHPEGMRLAMSKEESEKLKDRLSKALSSKNSNNIQSCNLHADCEEADEYARKHGKLWAEHCNDSSCDDHQ